MTRYVFTAEQRRRGGITRSRQPSFLAACSLGFERTCELHPFFARRHLALWIRRRDEAHRPIKQQEE